MCNGQRLDIFLCDATIILVGLLFFTMLVYAIIGKAERRLTHRRLMKRSKHDGRLLKLPIGLTHDALLTGAEPERVGTPTPPPSFETTKG